MITYQSFLNYMCMYVGVSRGPTTTFPAYTTPLYPCGYYFAWYGWFFYALPKIASSTLTTSGTSLAR